MPNCFELHKKGETVKTDFFVIDKELCDLVGETPHETHWVSALSDIPTTSQVGNWMDTIGMGLACGRSFADIKANYNDPRMGKFIDHLSAKYDVRAWAERR
jgi:hypothetical protein